MLLVLLLFICGNHAARVSFSVRLQPFLLSDGSFIRQSLPLEPIFHTQALDAFLRGLAIETSELFRQFDDGLGKILSIADEPELQDVSAASTLISLLRAAHIHVRLYHTHDRVESERCDEPLALC